MRKRSVFTAIVAQTTQNIWNFVVGKSSLQEIATLTIIREISDSNLEAGKIMLTELYYLHVSLSMKCTRPTRLVVGLICYRHSNWNTWNTTFSKSKIFSSFFCKWTNKIQAFNYAAIENFTPFELTRPLRKQTSNLWTLLLRLQKNLRKFCFQKMLCSKYFSLSVCNKLNQQLVLLVLYISLINLHEGNKALSAWFSHGL